MQYGKSKYWPNTWFASFKYEEDDGEPEYNKKWRWFEYYSWKRDYQGDYIVFYFDEEAWKKLNKKEYFIMWKLEGA